MQRSLLTNVCLDTTVMSLPLILVIEDHDLFKAGLTMALNTLQHIDIIETASIEQAMDYRACPDVILLDVQLNGMNGLDGIHMVRKKWPAAAVVMLSAHDSHANHEQALAAGAFAFLSKANATDMILSTVRRALIATGITLADTAHQDSDITALSERQIEVLKLLAKGMSNKVIGNLLGVSENTIRWHVRILLRALHVSTRAEATSAAHRLGLIS